MSEPPRIEHVLQDYAHKLATELREGGHDIQTLDLLDALACSRLTLDEDIHEQMTGAYYDALDRTSSR